MLVLRRATAASLRRSGPPSSHLLLATAVKPSLKVQAWVETPIEPFQWFHIVPTVPPVQFVRRSTDQRFKVQRQTIRIEAVPDVSVVQPLRFVQNVGVKPFKLQSSRPSHVPCFRNCENMIGIAAAEELTYRR